MARQMRAVAEREHPVAEKPAHRTLLYPCSLTGTEIARLDPLHALIQWTSASSPAIVLYFTINLLSAVLRRLRLEAASRSDALEARGVINDPPGQLVLRGIACGQGRLPVFKKGRKPLMPGLRRAGCLPETTLICRRFSRV